MKDHQHSEWLQTEHSSAPGDIFGEPKQKTRIGDEYHASIPTLMTEDERLQLMKIPTSKYYMTVVQDQANKQECAKGESWSVIEYHTFLLGLYMFGKNLGLVNKFMGNKGTQNVLSYYYGKFYGSKEHEKWSRCRKNRSKKYVPGKKIFSGWRQQKLFSRLFPHVMDECKRTLTDVFFGTIATQLAYYVFDSYMFKDGKLPFENYVFNVRDMVGVELFLEALAIGGGRQDLTSSTEMPRERKKKLHPSLVFLSPGIKKFSRRSLEKGSEYFESFTEVLNKVASEPALLEDQSVNPQGMDEEQDSVEFVVVEASTVSMERVLTMSEIRISSLSKPDNTSKPEESQNNDKNKIKFECNEQLDILNLTDAAGVITDQKPGPNGPKLSTRKRSLTEEALKARTSRSKNPKKRKQRTENCSRKRGGTKTALVASCGGSYAENGVAGVV